jgi:tetratricopeptide (TPR) repeat protein
MKNKIYGALIKLNIALFFLAFPAFPDLRAAAFALETDNSPLLSSAAFAGEIPGLAGILNELSPAGSGAAAHEKLRRFISQRDVLSTQEAAAIEKTLNEIIEKDIKNAEAHISFADLCEKGDNFQKAFYHLEMAVMAEPYNFNARRKINGLKFKSGRTAESVSVPAREQPLSAASAEAVSGEISTPPGGKAVSGDNYEAAFSDGEEIYAQDDEKLSATIKNNAPFKAGRENFQNPAAQEDPSAYKRSACHYIIKKEYTRASDLMAKALELDPSDNEANYLTAYIKYKLKKNNETLMYLNAINPETLTDAKLLHDIGVLWVRLKKKDEAVVFFTNGISCDRAYLDNYISLAVYYTQIKDYESAAKYFEEAVTIAPRDTKLLYFYALSSNKSGNYDKFISLADSILKIAPDGNYAKMIKRRLGLVPTDRLISYDNEKTLLNVAIAYFNDQDYARAELKLKEIIKINPDSFDANLYLARGAKNSRRMVEYAYYLLRLYLIKSNIAIELELARAFAALELNILSREFYLNCVNKNSGDMAVKLEYASMLRERGACISAKVVSESIVKNAKSPGEADAANFSLAEINEAASQDTDETGFGAIGAEAEENLYKLFMMLHENQMYKAVEKTGDILTANKADLSARILEIYSMSLGGLKKYNRAVEAYKLIIAKERSNYNAYLQLGRIYLKRNNFVRAEEYFRAANIFNSNDAEILMLLGDSCYYQKNIEDAEIAYQEALGHAPNAVIKEEIKLKLDKIKFKKRAR